MRFLLFIFFVCFLASLGASQNDSLIALDTDSMKYYHPERTNLPLEIENKNPDTHFGRLLVRESILPVGLALGSVLIMNITGFKVNLQNNLNWNNDLEPDYVDLGDDIVRYVPTIAAYTLSAFGLKSKHRFVDRSVIFAVSFIASDFVVHNMKNITKSTRPGRDSNSTDYSLPSQHTAMAFVAASFLDHELGYISPWISVCGYTLASYVGYARVARNRHWTSDVLLGAAVGLFTTNAIYWVYDIVINLFPKNFTMVPLINFQQKGLYFCYQF